MLSESDVRARFDSIKTWVRGDERAPHKPLLLLVALARVQRGEPRFVAYVDVEPTLLALLADFGPRRATPHPEQPFWRLQQDGIWEVTGNPEPTKAGDMTSKRLRDAQASGGFPDDVWSFLAARPVFVNDLVTDLLDRSFPDTWHETVLDAIGFPGVATSLRRRDPAFRQRILTIYEHRCAICGYDGRLGRSDLALEAAHVRWHAYDGPDAEDNGLALCAFHHKAFDRGAISLGDDRRILVSQEVHGHSRVAELLTGFAGQSLRSPILGTPPPAAEHTAWHRREVFWEPPRAS